MFSEDMDYEGYFGQKQNALMMDLFFTNTQLFFSQDVN